MPSLLQKAKEMFTSPEDLAFLKAQEERQKELQDISSLMADSRADALRRSVKADIDRTIAKLIETRDPAYIADLKAQFNLLEKFKASEELSALEAWLNEKIYGESN